MKRVKRCYIGTTLQIMIEIDNIYSIHYFQYVKNFAGLIEDHDFWEFVYVDVGRVTILAGEELVLTSQGEAYLHAPNQSHSIYSEDVYASVFIISFSTKGQDGQLNHLSKFKLTQNEQNIISHILKEATRAFTGALDIMDQTQLIHNKNALYGSEQLIKLRMEQLLIYIIRNNSETNYIREYPKDTGKQEHGQYIVDTVIHFLTGNLYNQLTLDEICQQVLFSKSYIEKVFRSNMGCGIIKYFNILKINEAKRLISEGKYNFTDIAHQLHFSSIHYFSRLFKSYVGMSPTEFTKSVRARGLL